MLTAAVPIVDPEERVPGVLLARALEETGIKGAQLARKLAVDAGTVSDWKHGRNPISPSRWIAIVAALKQMAPSWNPPAWEIGDPIPPAPPKPS